MFSLKTQLARHRPCASADNNRWKGRRCFGSMVDISKPGYCLLVVLLGQQRSKRSRTIIRLVSALQYAGRSRPFLNWPFQPKSKKRAGAITPTANMRARAEGDKRLGSEKSS